MVRVKGLEPSWNARNMPFRKVGRDFMPFCRTTFSTFECRIPRSIVHVSVIGNAVAGGAGKWRRFLAVMGGTRRPRGFRNVLFSPALNIQNAVFAAIREDADLVM